MCLTKYLFDSSLCRIFLPLPVMIFSFSHGKMFLKIVLIVLWILDLHSWWYADEEICIDPFLDSITAMRSGILQVFGSRLRKYLGKYIQCLLMQNISSIYSSSESLLLYRMKRKGFLAFVSTADLLCK